MVRKALIFLYLFFNAIATLNAVNHWKVTQNGKIEADLKSLFDLRRPYDLWALLEQENRAKDIYNLYKGLISLQANIGKKSASIESNSNVCINVMKEDEDCLATEKPLSTLDLYSNIAINGSDRGIDINISETEIDNTNQDFLIPFCKTFMNIKKSESYVNKSNISIKPEETLIDTFLPIKSVDHFGNYLVSSLQENSTSWVHYNLASFYWRIKGDGDKAIDCLKLAIQFATRNFQDIPLHNLAGILHQSRHSKEAVQILNSAIQLAPYEHVHYFAMANIHTAMMDFDKSVEFYDKFLKFEPNNKEAANNRHAVLCVHKWQRALASCQNELENILSDLLDYHSIQQQWLRLQERVMWEHAAFDLHYDVLRPEAFDNVQRCIKNTKGGKPIISCDVHESSQNLDTAKLQNLYQSIENAKNKLSVSELNLNGIHGFNEVREDLLNMKFPKFPTAMSTKGNQYFDVTGWPTKDECLEWNLPIDEPDDFNIPVFLPPENKGYQLKQALSDFLDLPEGAQHELPWYPPICDGKNVNGEKLIPLSHKQVLDADLKGGDFLKKEFLRYVNEGKADEHEIGQRIISAMSKRTAPPWVLATVASLYWRIRGNVRKTLDCLDMAFQMVSKDEMDVLLVSLGSVMHQLGFKDKANIFANLAFKINYIEPSTNFLLALIHYENNKALYAMYYMKNALRVEPDYYDGLAEKLLKTWACRIKLGVAPYISKQGLESKLSLCPSHRTKKEGIDYSPIDLLCEKVNLQCGNRDDELCFEVPVTEEQQEIFYRHLKSENLDVF